MQKYVMFEDVPADYKVMYPSGKIKTKDEVIGDYPVLGTPMGVVGVTVTKDGVLTNPIRMGSYYDIMTLEDTYEAQGCAIDDGLTNAEKCEVITEFVNQPSSE